MPGLCPGVAAQRVPIPNHMLNTKIQPLLNSTFIEYLQYMVNSPSPTNLLHSLKIFVDDDHDDGGDGDDAFPASLKPRHLQCIYHIYAYV